MGGPNRGGRGGDGVAGADVIRALASKDGRGSSNYNLEIGAEIEIVKCKVCLASDEKTKIFRKEKSSDA